MIAELNPSTSLVNGSMLHHVALVNWVYHVDVCVLKNITMWLMLQYFVKESKLRIPHDNSFVFYATFRSFTVNKSSTCVVSHIPIGLYPKAIQRTRKKNQKFTEEDKWRLEIVLSSPIKKKVSRSYATKSPRIWSNVAALWCTPPVQCLWMLFRQHRFGGG